MLFSEHKLKNHRKKRKCGEIAEIGLSAMFKPVKNAKTVGDSRDKNLKIKGLAHDWVGER